VSSVSLDELIAAATILFAFDAAFPPLGSVYLANGGIAANVYVSGNYAQDAAHVAGLRAAGIAPWPNYEVGLTELISDRATGQRAGLRGINDAIRCSFPANGSIWFPFSVDVSVDPTQYWKVRDAFLGVQDVNAGRYLISCYGQGGLISYLRAQGIINQKGWLSASSAFPGYSQASLDICMWQQVGNFISGYSTDRNVITDVSSLRAWWPNGSPYAQGGRLFMTLTDAQELEIYNACHYLNAAFNIGALRTQIPSGEFGLALRQLRDQWAHIATDADVAAVPTQVHNDLLGTINRVVALAGLVPPYTSLADVASAVEVVKSSTDSVEATQVVLAAAQTAHALQLANLKAQVADLPTPPTVDEIVASAVAGIKADPPPGWDPTDAQLAHIAGTLAEQLPKISYAGTLAPVPPLDPSAAS
jgi:hypothetical protein